MTESLACWNKLRNLANCHFLNEKWIEAADMYDGILRGIYRPLGSSIQSTLPKTPEIHLHRLLCRSYLGTGDLHRALRATCVAIHTSPPSLSLWCDMALILKIVYSKCEFSTFWLIDTDLWSSLVTPVTDSSESMHSKLLKMVQKSLELLQYSTDAEVEKRINALTSELKSTKSAGVGAPVKTLDFNKAPVRWRNLESDW